MNWAVFSSTYGPVGCQIKEKFILHITYMKSENHLEITCFRQDSSHSKGSELASGNQGAQRFPYRALNYSHKMGLGLVFSVWNGLKGGLKKLEDGLQGFEMSL